MSDFVVTEDQMGGLHLYETNFTRPKPIAEWHGFQSYQDLSDFFSFGLRGPWPWDPLPTLPPELRAGPAAGAAILEVLGHDEITKEGRRGEYSPRPDDGVPPSLASCTYRVGLTTCGYQEDAPMHEGSLDAAPPAGRHRYSPEPQILEGGQPLEVVSEPGPTAGDCPDVHSKPGDASAQDAGGEVGAPGCSSSEPEDQ